MFRPFVTHNQCVTGSSFVGPPPRSAAGTYFLGTRDPRLFAPERYYNVYVYVYTYGCACIRMYNNNSTYPARCCYCDRKSHAGADRRGRLNNDRIRGVAESPILTPVFRTLRSHGFRFGNRSIMSFPQAPCVPAHSQSTDTSHNTVKPGHRRTSCRYRQVFWWKNNSV